MDLIIGAGITGLSYANFCGHDDYLIVEKDHEIGGYCKTIQRNGFIWDYSGHFFHSRNVRFENMLVESIGEDNLLRLKKETQIRYKDLYIDFPFQMNIHQLDKTEFIDCLYDLFFSNVNSFTSFKEMLYHEFGKSISEKFLIPYNEKLYACDLNTLDKDAMGRFFPKIQKMDIIKNFKSHANGFYNSYFTYPKNGSIEYINSLMKGVDARKLHLNAEVLYIDIEKRIASTTKGKFKFDRIISSIPFPSLLRACRLYYDQSLFSWNKVLVFNLGFDKPSIDKTNHWIYFPEKKYSFYRVGYYNNILGQEKMSLYVEIGFDKNESVDIEKYLKLVISDLNIAGIVVDHNLEAYHYIVMNPAYVHINQKSIKGIKIYNKKLSMHNIFSIGRYGSWTYCSIEDNMAEAMKLATEFKM